MNDYLSPVRDLLDVGETAGVRGRDWDDYRHFGFGQEHVSDLIRMATDMDLNTSRVPKEYWAPLHAWRALAGVSPVAALDAMLTIHKAMLEETNSFQPAEDIIDLSARMGADALPALERYLSDHTMGAARDYVANAIGDVGKSHPECRAECVRILIGALEPFAQNEENVNGGLIAALLDVNAVEAAPLMERAFASGKVDESIAGDWSVVQYELGLTDKKPTWKNPLFEALRARHGDTQPRLHIEPSQRNDRKSKRKAERQAKKKNRQKKR